MKEGTHYERKTRPVHRFGQPILQELHAGRLPHQRGDGCKAWEKYFIDNWNKNIMKSIGNHKKQRQFFRYEHPDLVREGIVFEHEQGENVRLFHGEAELHPAQVGESSSGE